MDFESLDFLFRSFGNFGRYVDVVVHGPFMVASKAQSPERVPSMQAQGKVVLILECLVALIL